jgi:hypothetical protein
MNTKRFNAIAKLLPGSTVVTECPSCFVYLDGFVGGVLLEEGDTFTMMYQQQWPNSEKTWVRGITGFRCAGQTFTFDRRGVEDSWYPDGHDKRICTQVQVAAAMKEQLIRAATALAKRTERETSGTKINFGPTTRTLMPDEIADLRKRLAANRTFEFRPAGFGTGYRFYQSRTPGRYGSRVPASEEARKFFAAPYLVYDTMDCD